MRGELGAEVAAPLLGIPHARHEGVEHRVVEPGRRDHDAFLVEPARVGGETAGLLCADVRVVGPGDRKADLRSGH